MLENRPATAAEAPAERSLATVAKPRTQRSQITNNPLRARTDRNTARGRRVADLYLAYMAALGSQAANNTLIQANVIAAAELRVACEDARTKVLEGGGGGDADQLVRLENLTHRAERKLGLDHHKPKSAPSLQSYLAELAKQPKAVADDDGEEAA
jgi:hypothetical protein